MSNAQFLVPAGATPFPNVIAATVTTSDALGQVQIAYTFPLGSVPGVYLFESSVVAYNVTDSRAATFKSYRAVRTDGVTPVFISAQTAFDGQDEDFTPDDAELTSSFVFSLVGNSLRTTATGVSPKVINWRIRTIYDFIG